MRRDRKEEDGGDDGACPELRPFFELKADAQGSLKIKWRVRIRVFIAQLEKVDLCPPLYGAYLCPNTKNAQGHGCAFQIDRRLHQEAENFENFKKAKI